MTYKENLRRTPAYQFWNVLNRLLANMNMKPKQRRIALFSMWEQMSFNSVFKSNKVGEQYALCLGLAIDDMRRTGYYELKKIRKR